MRSYLPCGSVHSASTAGGALVLLDTRTGRMFQLNPTGASALAAVATAALRSLRFQRIERLARWLVHTAPHSAGATEIEAMLAAIDRAGQWLPARVACLERSLAVLLWCGLRRRSVCWRIGVRTPPFTAHSWIEVAGQAVGERAPVHSYQPIFTIGHAEPEGP